MDELGSSIIKKVVDEEWNVSALDYDDIDENGCIYFSFPAGDIVEKDFEEEPSFYIHQIMGSFFADTLGELILRKNSDFFLELFLNISHNDYMRYTEGVDHIHFGMAKKDGLILMQFHISILSKIFLDIFFDKVEQG